jgi:type IV pilus assembly protein PilV
MHNIDLHDFKAPSQSGFTLLEVLIAMVVLSIGLFGLAGMQTMTMRANTSSYHRSLASMLANDMMDRIRSNPTIAKASSDDYQGTWDQAAAEALFLADPLDPGSGIAEDTHACYRGNTGCTPEDLRDYDLWYWVTKPHMLRQLPGAEVTIDRETVETNFTYNFTITITWNDFHYANDDKTGASEFIYSSIVRMRP